MAEDKKEKKQPHRNKKNNYSYSEKGANLSIIKIDSVHCFCCGNQFDPQIKGGLKTKHHAIPEELKPVRNIIIPVCRNCHDKIHLDSQAMNPKTKKVVRKLDGIKNQVTKINEQIDKTKKELE